MRTIEITQQDMLAAEAGLAGNTGFFMFNMLRYKPQAEYASRYDFEPCTGQEAYFKRYIPVFLELAAGRPEIKPFWIGSPLTSLVPGSAEKWDTIALISYPNFQSFKDIVESEAYLRRALPHRLAAIDDWKLIATVTTDVATLLGNGA
jgi:hypothetical protein